MKKYRISIYLEEWIENDNKFVEYEAYRFCTDDEDVPHIRKDLEVFFE
jgi:hypothetical protein